MDLAYRILNVFTVDGDRLSGNPLCVFEDGRTLDGTRMQALARQFNLSETTFLLPATQPGATARVRIFTPDFEMPFAGHPTLGTAHVARAVLGAGDRLGLEMPAGLVPVEADGDRWTLQAARAPEVRPTQAPPATLATMLGLPAAAVLPRPLWVNTGVEQFIIPLRSAADVGAARPDATLLGRHGRPAAGGEAMAYVFAPRPDGELEARFFFLSGGGVVEDPATGSACANLGGYLLATDATLPAHRMVHQGAAVRRPSRLALEVTADRRIRVTGAVVELGRGWIRL